ncbi:hypothetical protein LZZ85_21865 [Terrimonas sp. NA20]|uniref:Uncharacterized protein n=1 Tax=Terrimonas ginsenosidimutans TaxID=2908004 RepID=A0ABS9KXK4_9BACT|nr:hypothetical protein [Terrimonas ginsenosidimutans]MCG2616959.1 hypothetical protein [Terrimonas ginsenosidimutans]
MEVDLNGLTPVYLLKHIASDPAKYADVLFLSLERAMFRTLSFIGVEDYLFSFLFKFQGELIKRQVNYYFLSKTRAMK